MPPLDTFLLGAMSMGCLAVSVFFLRFWRSSRDTLFLWFAVSFGVEAANRAALALLGHPNETRPTFFVLRLLSYGLIIAGIVSKNLPRRPG